MRSEVTDGAETLTGALKGHLAAANGDEQLLQSAFRFKSKAHGSLYLDDTQHTVRVS